MVDPYIAPHPADEPAPIRPLRPDAPEASAAPHPVSYVDTANKLLLAEPSIASPFEEEQPAQHPASANRREHRSTTLNIDDSQQFTPSFPSRPGDHRSRRKSHGRRRPSGGENATSQSKTPFSHSHWPTPPIQHRHIPDHATSVESDQDEESVDEHDAHAGLLSATAHSMVSSIKSVGRRIAARAEQERSAQGLRARAGGENDPETHLLFDAEPETQGLHSSSENDNEGPAHPDDRSRPRRKRRRHSGFSPPPVPPAGESGQLPTHYATRASRSQSLVAALPPRERALWQWVNIVDLDAFLREAYSYYYGKGFVAIVLTKLVGLATFAFVVSFSTFLGGCLDYTQIQHDSQLGDVIVPHCFARFTWSSKLLYFFVFLIFIWQCAATAVQIPQLWAMRRFYTYVLGIPDSDVASISWNEVVNRLAHLRETNPIVSLEPRPQTGVQPTERSAEHVNGMDAHDVANRIMRQENYLIALFNQDVPNLRLPLSPRLAFYARFVGITPEPVLTRSLLWNLKYCLLDFLFDENGVLRKQFLSENYRAPLIRGLRHRFYFMALVNTACSPFIVLYVLVYSFLRYFEEYHKDPSHLGSRQYTEWARWKFREFNELPHLFKRRMHRSYPAARLYINQFPKESVAILARFVGFVAGSFTAILLLASLYDADLFLHFYLSPQRSVLFYVSVFATITAVARGMIPEEHLVFDPEQTLAEVVEHIHYLPPHWIGHMHSAKVHQEFGHLCQLKIMLFITELWSVLLTPFILWRSLPQSAPDIIDFFRLNTTQVDGLGYVCAFADFNHRDLSSPSRTFGKTRSSHTLVPEENSEQAHVPTQTQTRDQGGVQGPTQAGEDKLEQSVWNFKSAHPDWHPNQAAVNAYLTRKAQQNHQYFFNGLDTGQESVRGPNYGQGSRQRPGEESKRITGIGQGNSPSSLRRRQLTFTPINSLLLGSHLGSGAVQSQYADPTGVYAGFPATNTMGRSNDFPTGFGREEVRGLQAVQESQNCLPGATASPGQPATESIPDAAKKTSTGTNSGGNASVGAGTDAKRQHGEKGAEDDEGEVLEPAASTTLVAPTESSPDPTPQDAAAQAGVRGMLDQMYLQGPAGRRW